MRTLKELLESIWNNIKLSDPQSPAKWDSAKVRWFGREQQ